MTSVICYPPTFPVRTTEPEFTQEPVSLSDAKRQCNLADGISFHDDRIRSFIVEARQRVEHDAGLICYTGTHTWKFTDFPIQDWFEFDVRPVTSITSIAYIDSTGSSQTWTATQYALENSGTGAPLPLVPLVRLTYGNVWPTLRGDINGVTVTFVGGYATVLAIPRKIKEAVLLQVKLAWFLYQNDFDQTARYEEAYDRQIELIRREVYA